MLGLFWFVGSTCLPNQERPLRDSFNSVVLVLSEADKRWSFPMLTGKAVSGDAYLRIYYKSTDSDPRSRFVFLSFSPCFASGQDQRYRLLRGLQVYFHILFTAYIYLQKYHHFTAYIRWSNNLIAIVPRPRCRLSERPCLNDLVLGNTLTILTASQEGIWEAPQNVNDLFFFDCAWR